MKQHQELWPYKCTKCPKVQTVAHIGFLVLHDLNRIDISPLLVRYSNTAKVAKIILQSVVQLKGSETPPNRVVMKKSRSLRLFFVQYWNNSALMWWKNVTFLFAEKSTLTKQFLPVTNPLTCHQSEKTEIYNLFHRDQIIIL